MNAMYPHSDAEGRKKDDYTTRNEMRGCMGPTKICIIINRLTAS